MDTFDIRITTPMDEAVISRVLSAAYSTLMPAGFDPDILNKALPIITRANPALLASGTYYCAQAGDDRVVGCGGWTMARPGSGEVNAGLGHIRHFATHPDCLGQGVGKLIYQHCADAARENGITAFECYSCLNAEGFYAALGFSKVEQVDIAMGPALKLPSIVMRVGL